MLRLRPIAAGLLLAMTPLVATAQAPPEDETFSDGEIGGRIVEFARQAESLGFSGAVLAARDGKVVAAVGVGSADLEGEVPNTPATLFEIASVSKQFTAAAVMKLVDDGRLKLDDPIAAHLPDGTVPEICAAITIEHLLRHTSGIPGSNAEGGGDDIAAVLPGLLRGGPRHEPGTRWEYWNQGYAIVTEIIASASGLAFTVYSKEALFEPAGMMATRFTGDEAPEGKVVAVGRSARGPARGALEHPYGSFGFQYRGMGGVVTNVWDLWQWDRALRRAERGEVGEQVLSAAAVSQLFQVGPGGYALGWFVGREGGRVVQRHGGRVRGFACEVRRYPGEGALLVVLANRDDAPIGRVVRSLEEILFADPADGSHVGDAEGAKRAGG